MLNRFRWFGSIPVWVADFVVGHPFWVLAILVALTGAAGYSARNLRFDFNPEAVFSGENPTVKYAKEFSRDFGNEENVIIVGFEATGDANVVTPTALTWQAETVHAFEKISHVLRVESLISMETPRVTFSLPPKISYEPIISETPVSADTAEVLRDRLAQTEMPFGSLVSKDYKMAAELVVFDATQQDFDAMERMVKNVDETLARFPVPTGYRTVVSGLPVLRVGIVRDLGKDQTRLMPLAGILYLITLALVFRSVSGSTLPLIAVGQGLIWTFGVMAFWGQPLNIVSNILPCMLLINGVSNSIHVLTRYSEEAVHPGTTRRDASRRTIRQMLVACLGAFATAAVGFFVLRTASSPVLQEFGTQAAMGLSFL
jgi:predicted RND superfamily exporter protein